MKRISLQCACLLLFFAASDLHAVRGDCNETCNISEACGVEDCMSCVVPYDEDDCVQWELVSCEQAGICGGCVTLETWSEDSFGGWHFMEFTCTGYERYANFYRDGTRTYYELRRCNGQTSTVAVRTEPLREFCSDYLPPPCSASDYPVARREHPNCPF